MRVMRILLVLATVVGAFSITSTALASTKDCPTGQCQYKNAIVHTTPGTPATPGTPGTAGTPSTTTTVQNSTTHVVIHSKVTENIRTYEKVAHKVVLVANKADGIKSSAGCVDPVARGLITVGGNFDNSGGNHPNYWTGHWVNGQKICGFHKTQIDGQLVFVGFKNNCKNRIRIWVGQHTFKKYIPILEVRSTRTFERMYEKWVTTQKKTTTVVTPGTPATPSTPGTPATPGTTTYSCSELGAGWVPVAGNPAMCQNCPAPATCTPPASAVITSMTDLNDIPEGKFSTNYFVTVNVSAAGVLTIDPGNGSISDCNGGPRLLAGMTVNVPAGTTTVCATIWAPAESSVNSGTVTATVTVNGTTAKDQKVDTYEVKHPVRP